MKTLTIDFSIVQLEQEFFDLLNANLNWDFKDSSQHPEVPPVLILHNLNQVKEQLPVLFNQFINWAKDYQQSHGDKALVFYNSSLTEKEKMLSGLLYQASDPTLTKERERARLLFQKFNRTGDELVADRLAILGELIGTAGKNLFIEPPFYCDYGINITLGDNVFINYNCILLDVMPITIGNDVLIAPNVQIYTATHPMVKEPRSALYEYAKPITIGNDVWIGGGAIICPGVTLGNNVVVGAGAVVTKSFGDNVFIAGNPAKVIKEVE